MKTGLFLNQQNISSTNNNIKKADYLSKNSIKANLQQDTVSFSGSRSKRKKAAKEQANKQAYVIADDNMDFLQKLNLYYLGQKNTRAKLQVQLPVRLRLLVRLHISRAVYLAAEQILTNFLYPHNLILVQ